MSRGMRSLFENAAPSLILALVVLLGGIGYGLYERHANPVGEAPAQETSAPSTSN